MTANNALTLKVDDNGAVQMGTLQDQMAFAEHLIRSGMLPKAYQRAEHVVAAWQLAVDVGLKPGVKALSKIAVINGTPNLFAEGPLAIVQASGKMEAFEGFYVDPNGKRICHQNENLKAKRWGYVFRSKRLGSETWYEESYDLDQAKAAGLGNVWNKHPDDLLKWRTTTKNLKTNFADVMMGVAVAEYDANAFVMPGGSYEQTKESDLNERFEDTIPADKPTMVTEAAFIPEVIPPIPAANVAETVATAPSKNTFREIANKAATANKEWPDPEKFVEEKAHTLANDGYIIPIGKHKGKLLAKLPLDEAFQIIPGVKAFVQKNPNDLVAKEMLDMVTDYCEGAF